MDPDQVEGMMYYCLSVLNLDCCFWQHDGKKETLNVSIINHLRALI